MEAGGGGEGGGGGGGKIFPKFNNLSQKLFCGVSDIITLPVSAMAGVIKLDKKLCTKKQDGIIEDAFRFVFVINREDSVCNILILTERIVCVIY